MGQNNEEEMGVMMGEVGVVRWEEFMPKMVIRVLLVEPDDSTRQILTALLRKSNYQVAAIADGLQAWEILKRRHNCIDLILTELDLPSISGYALLALITEHDSCKNIPVIVTSSQDSMSMVLKCTLKGATDFLIKPVRKNELKNLWRHVWRRLAISGHDSQNLATEQHKAKADHSGDNVSTTQKSSKCIEKATDAPVSALREDGDGSSTGIATEYKSVGHSGSDGLRPNEESEPCRGAMDLIGSMNKSKCIVAQASYDEEFSSLDSIPELKLSLKIVHDSKIKEEDESHSLDHSNASALSWYNSTERAQASCPLSSSELTDVKEAMRSSSFNSIGDDEPTAGRQTELVPLSETVFDGGVRTGYATMFNSIAGPGRDLSVKSPNSAFHRENSPFLTSPSPHSDPGTYSSSVNNSSGHVGNEFADEKVSASESASDLTDVNTNGPDMAGTSVLKKVVNGESCNTFDLDQFRHRTGHHSEREAALARFRLKRKERCYDKKVRYQSRKKQAEQRPRVKGHFVRQVPF